MEQQLQQVTLQVDSHAAATAAQGFSSRSRKSRAGCCCTHVQLEQLSSSSTTFQQQQL